MTSMGSGKGGREEVREPVGRGHVGDGYGLSASHARLPAAPGAFLPCCQLFLEHLRLRRAPPAPQPSPTSDAHGGHGLGREADALGEERDGGEQHKGDDGDDAEEVDVVQAALACRHNDWEAGRAAKGAPGTDKGWRRRRQAWQQWSVRGGMAAAGAPRLQSCAACACACTRAAAPLPPCAQPCSHPCCP